MCRLMINGAKPLFGKIHVQGSKNAVLPIMAATLLTKSECTIHNCPEISDVYSAMQILTSLGCKVHLHQSTLTIAANGVCKSTIKKELMQKMRSSVMFLGAMLSRCGEAQICMPGGCRLGSRPIDIHIDALKRLGAEIDENGDCITCRLSKVSAGKIILLYPSVGATENIMLMSAISDGICEIYNPAREPEIVDLQNFLNAMGADISGAGSDLIVIRGVPRLCGCEYSVMPDRIVAATCLLASAACGGEVKLSGILPEGISMITEILERTGCNIFCEDTAVTVSRRMRQIAVPSIKTLPYPGFPTDVQPILAAYLATANGTSEINELIFDGRFGYTKELKKMGADIRLKNNRIQIYGVEALKGCEVHSADLRGGAALVVAGLSAEGETSVSGLEYIDRGYEKIEENFRRLGADITRVM